MAHTLCLAKLFEADFQGHRCLHLGGCKCEQRAAWLMLGTSTHQGAISTLCCRGYVWVHEEPAQTWALECIQHWERKVKEELNVDDTLFGVPLGHENQRTESRAREHHLMDTDRPVSGCFSMAGSQGQLLSRGEQTPLLVYLSLPLCTCTGSFPSWGILNWWASLPSRGSR